MGIIVKFRRLKHGSPRKFKVLAEDFRRESNLSWTTFTIVVIGTSILAFGLTVVLGGGSFAFRPW